MFRTSKVTVDLGGASYVPPDNKKEVQGFIYSRKQQTYYIITLCIIHFYADVCIMINDSERGELSGTEYRFYFFSAFSIFLFLKYTYTLHPFSVN